MLAASLQASDDDQIDADRPGIADGSRGVKAGRFQIEIGPQREHSGGEISLSVPTLLRYGISDSFELRVESDTYEHTTSHRQECLCHTGWNPVSIGFKDHFYERDGRSLGVIGRWFFPSGSGAFRSDSNSEDLRLGADLTFGERWAINPNIGVQHPGGATAALTVQYNISEKSNVFIDGGAQRSEVLVDTGAAWIVGSNTQFDVSVGFGSHVFWSAGLSRRF